MSLSLILGGARSGKSAYAEKRAIGNGKRLIYIATAQALDAEMKMRIAHHQARRNSNWTTHEESLHLAQVLAQYDDAGNVILVDCLTLWLSNCALTSELETSADNIDGSLFFHEREKLFKALSASQADVILVANEVGLGIVPMGALSRWFVDEAGRLNQALAQLCHEVVFVAAGLPMILKKSEP